MLIHSNCATRYFPLKLKHALPLLMLFINLTAAQMAFSQPVPLAKWEHKSWSIADGSPKLIYDAVQGKDGLLWLSTTMGLYRFDGTHFTEFIPPAGTPKGTIRETGRQWSLELIPK